MRSLDVDGKILLNLQQIEYEGADWIHAAGDAEM
jgi:hypothetical protein